LVSGAAFALHLRAPCIIEKKVDYMVLSITLVYTVAAVALVIAVVLVASFSA
jgi:hypothetical protein